MRNYLCINYENGWVYFDTNYDEVMRAYDEYLSISERVGINVDNLNVKKLEVRRSYDHTIIDWNEKRNGEWVK